MKKAQFSETPHLEVKINKMAIAACAQKEGVYFEFASNLANRAADRPVTLRNVTARPQSERRRKHPG